MLKNYLKISLRNLTKEKSFTVINLLGLAIGITGFIALALYVFDELGYDKMYKNSDRIYRVFVHQKINSEESWNSKTPSPFGSTIKQLFPEVESFTRVGYFGKHVLKYGDKVFRESDIYTADSTYFQVFDLPLVAGDKNSVLSQSNSIVITETAAKKYFGNENPVGKTFVVDNSETYLITGLMKDFPKKSHFSCDFLLSMSTYPIADNQYWLDLWYTTYVLLKEGTDIEKLQSKLKIFVTEKFLPQAEKHLGVSLNDFFKNGNMYEYIFQPLTSIYLYSQREFRIDLNTEWGDVKSGDIVYVYIAGAIAVFILLLAVINFINLSTAKSEKRAKEVGIRKTLGSDRMKLILQFITESTLMVFLSVIIALALLELLLPVFSKFINRELRLDLFESLLTIPLLIIFIITLGVIAGSYPAFYLSSFQPVQVIKPGYAGKGKRQTLRSLMVIGQFVISITLITVTIIINQQLKFIQNKNLGFQKEQLVILNNANVIKSRMKAFKNELSKNPNILSMTSSSLLFQTGIPGSGYIFNSSSAQKVISANYLDVDHDFLETFQINMKAGRFFSEDFTTDSNAVVINESAVSEFGGINPIGQTINRIENKPVNEVYTVIGIVKDFHYQSLHEVVHPLAFHLGEDRHPASILTLRIAAEDMINTIEYVKNIWRDFAGDETFSYSFVNDKLAKYYESEKMVGIITSAFSGLAIFVACLGLFGLVAFVAEQKTKEIGIRKVMGASVMEILILLSKQFTKWVIVASVIASPIAYYFMESWLQDFAYRTEIDWSIFLIAGLIALLIALLTISIQTIKAALANPVKSLKYE